MKNITYTVVFILFLLSNHVFSQNSVAEQNLQSETSEGHSLSSKPTSSAINNAVDNSTTKQSNNNDFDVFQPSENLLEDQAIDFPVDI